MGCKNVSNKWINNKGWKCARLTAARDLFYLVPCSRQYAVRGAADCNSRADPRRRGGKQDQATIQADRSPASARDGVPRWRTHERYQAVAKLQHSHGLEEENSWQKHKRYLWNNVLYISHKQLVLFCIRLFTFHYSPFNDLFSRTWDGCSRRKCQLTFPTFSQK